MAAAPATARSATARSAIAAGAITAFATVWWAMSAGVPPLSWADRAGYRWSVTERRHTDVVETAQAVTVFGGHPWLLVVAAVAAIGLLLRRRYVGAVAVLAAAATTLLVRELLVRLIDRPRPVSPFSYQGGLAFPSGHATESMATAVIVIVLALAWRRRWLAVTLATAAVSWTAAMGLSRVILGAHWISDVLAGWLLGLGWPLLVIQCGVLVSATLARHRRAPDPV